MFHSVPLNTDVLKMAGQSRGGTKRTPWIESYIRCYLKPYQLMWSTWKMERILTGLPATQALINDTQVPVNSALTTKFAITFFLDGHMDALNREKYWLDSKQGNYCN